MKEKKGLIHIYCGEGKGKTTAACGLALRAAGYKRKIYMFFFFKSPLQSGEMRLLSKLKNSKLFYFDKRHPFFVKQKRLSYKRKLKPQLNEFLKKVRKVLKKKEKNLIVLDEILTAVAGKLILPQELLSLLEEKNCYSEVVLTGRCCLPRQISAAADYISEIKDLKHPHEKGICAREGVDF